jgi:hypothetical protein
VSGTDVESLIEELQGDGVQLRLENGELRYRAPQGALSPARKTAIANAKPQIIEVIASHASRGRVSPEVENSEAVWLPTGGQEAAARTPRGMRMWDVRRWRIRLDAAAAQSACDLLIQRHSVLRTRYVLDNNRRMWAVTERAAAVPIEIVDLRSVDAAFTQKEGRRIARSLVSMPFNVYSGPLLRMTLLRLNCDEFVSIFVVDHSIFDGWSFGVFLSELQTAYTAELERRTVRFPLPPFEFRDHAVRQNTWLESEDAHRHLLYWHRKVSGARRPFWIPRDRRTPIEVFDDMSQIGSGVGVTTADGLRRLAQRERCSIFTCISTALGLLLSGWTRSEDVFLWIMHSGRGADEADHLIGMYMDCWLLRMGFDGDPSFAEGVRRVRANYLEAVLHLRVTPGMLAPILKRAGGGQVHPSAVLNFVSQVSPDPQLRESAAVSEPLDWVPGPAHYDGDSDFALLFNVLEHPGGISWSIRHNNTLFEEATIERASRGLAQLLDAVALQPNMTCSELWKNSPVWSWMYPATV